MSCQPYLQWWISPLAHLLLKTDHLVSVLLPSSLPALLILPLLPCSFTSFIILFVFCISHAPVVVRWFFSIYPVFTLISAILCVLQSSSKLNDSCLWPLQRNTSVLCPPHTVCFTVVGLLSSLLHLSAHVCSKPASDCLLSIQYPSQVKGSRHAPISSKPSLK